MKEKKPIIKNAAMEINNDELERVTGGYVPERRIPSKPAAKATTAPAPIPSIAVNLNLAKEGLGLPCDGAENMDLSKAIPEP